MIAWHIIVLTVIDISSIRSAILERRSTRSIAGLSLAHGRCKDRILVSDPGAATSEERMRSHVPNAIGPMFRILWLSVVWRGRLGRELAELGVSVANMQRLARLSFLPEGATQRELARTMDIDPPTLVRVLDLLEKADYIRRQSDPTDRRLKRILLTDGGRAVWEIYKQTTPKLETDLTGEFDRGARSYWEKQTILS